MKNREDSKNSQPNTLFDDIDGSRDFLQEFIDPTGILDTLISHKKAFIIIMLLLMFGGAGFLLMLDNQYSATATILPPDQPSAISKLMGSVGGALGSAMGGGGNSFVRVAPLYPNIVSSNTVLGKVLEHQYQGQNYFDFFKEIVDVEEYEGDVQKERAAIFKHINSYVISTSVNDRTYIIEVSATLTSPERAAHLANAVVIELENYLTMTMDNAAKRQLEQIDARLKQVEDSLAISEEKLLKFQEDNRSILNSPSLQLRFGRLKRDVEVNNGIYVELMRQREIAKVEAISQSPPINIINWATPPLLKSAPTRTRMLLLILVLGGGITFIFFRIKDLQDIDIRKFFAFISEREKVLKSLNTK